MPAVCASLATPPDGVCVPLSGVRFRPPHVRLLRSLHKPTHGPLAGCSPQLPTGGSPVRRVFWPCPDVGSHGLHHLWQGESCKCFAQPSRHLSKWITAYATGLPNRTRLASARSGGSLLYPSARWVNANAGAMCHSSVAHAWDRPYPLWPPEGWIEPLHLIHRHGLRVKREKLDYVCHVSHDAGGSEVTRRRPSCLLADVRADEFPHYDQTWRRTQYREARRRRR